MDATAFGLSRDPFQRSTDLDDACLPNPLAALLSEMQSGMRCPQGVSVLVGEPASGKSMVARAFARRLCGVARTALIPEPSSSVSAIARDALAALGDPIAEENGDCDWVAALRDHAAHRAAAGAATVVIVDDAHRLSPQALEDLTSLFEEEEPLRLHIFLVGRPGLLDRMNAGSERALLAHLLQICRIEPLGVRECVRYLERRLAMCGGELARLFDDGAIEDIVGRAEGRLLVLEELAAGALAAAQQRGATQVLARDVATPRLEAAAEEEWMAPEQQHLRFEVAAETPEDDKVAWGDEADDEEWVAEDAASKDDFDDSSMGWDSGELESSDAGFDDDEVDGLDDLEDEAPPTRRRAPGPPAERQRFFGRAVLSAAACLSLVWVANHLPGSGADSTPGRDAVLFAEPLTEDPAQILRLAETAEAADADAHVLAWHEAPPVVAKAVPARDREAAPPDQLASLEEDDAGVASRVSLPVREGADESPWDEPSAAAPAPAPPKAKAVAPAKAATAPKAASKPATGKAKAVAAPAKGKSTPVYTVQLGAFKTRRNAEDMVGKMRGKPTKIVLEGGLYRVLSGSFPTRTAAVAHEGTLRRAGYSTFVRTAVF